MSLLKHDLKSITIILIDSWLGMEIRKLQIPVLTLQIATNAFLLTFRLFLHEMQHGTKIYLSNSVHRQLNICSSTYGQCFLLKLHAQCCSGCQPLFRSNRHNCELLQTLVQEFQPEAAECSHPDFSQVYELFLTISSLGLHQWL